jgi:short-subunit dehydrogenase involved in D-alanine esterification of teichoic acids
MSEARNQNHRTVLVTGGSEGLGLAIGQAFATLGHEVIACARTAAKLADAATQIPGLITIRADVSVAADRTRIFTEVAAQGATVDILINNAAITRPHDYTSSVTLDTDQARDEIEVNLHAPIEMTRLFLAERRRTGRDADPGTVVMIGTPGALIPLEAQPLYCTTKAGLHMFTLALRRQLRETATRVVEVFPPALPTALTRGIEVATDNGGPEVTAEVAREIRDAILRDEEVILPHEQSRRLYNALPALDQDFVDRVNAGVRRAPDWETAVG